MYYGFVSVSQDLTTQLNMFLANSSTLLMPCREHPWNLPRLISKAEATEAHISVIMSHLPADKDHLETYSKAQANDPLCSQLKDFCQMDGLNDTESKESYYATGQPEQTSPYVKAYFCLAHALWYQRSCSTKHSVRSIKATKGLRDADSE